MGKVDIVFKKKHDPRQLLLFNDMLLVCKIKKGKGSLYKLEFTTQISDIIVTNLADEESARIQSLSFESNSDQTVRTDS